MLGNAFVTRFEKKNRDQKLRGFFGSDNKRGSFSVCLKRASPNSSTTHSSVEGGAKVVSY